ncbi:uncharacterized protein LOC123562627 [Mercenaria mercenaria]|uniref:uncharacterized protein LOC123562627 n=1 Tax=Mercenaria mercenaria TaxID=6596 RepID=UPI00234E7046|nr:uncharacterized protein LOC123562627 [Mercenaria mercenaria]
MCNRKTKVRFMTLAIVCLCLSFATQFIGFVIPSWLHVKIDGTNITNDIYSVNETDEFIDMTENYDTANDNEYDYGIGNATNNMFNNFNEIWLNSTGVINETVNYANRSFALWYINTCVNGKCQMELYPELKNGTYYIQNYFDPGYNFSWIDSRVPFSRQREFQIEATVALVLTFIAVILVWDNKKKFVQDIGGRISEKCHSIRHCIVIAVVSVSGTLIGIPCMEYGNANVYIQSLVAKERSNGTGYRPVTVGIPFGLIFSWLSNILASLACMFIFFTLSIRKKDNTVHRTDIIALNPVQNGGGQQNHVVPSAPPCFSAHGSIPENVHVGETNTNGVPYRNSVNANTHTENDCGIYELPPPSYEETMRLYRNNQSTECTERLATTKH